MSQIKPIQCKNDRIIYVQMDEVDIPAVLPPSAGKHSDLLEGAEPVSFKEDAIDALMVLQSNIQTLAETVYDSLKANQPEEWTLEVNIGFKGKTCPIPVILSGEASGAIKVTAKWKRDSARP